jgi:hypothetical protein
MTKLGKSTLSLMEEDQDAAPIRVDVAPRVPPESYEFGTFRKSLAREPGDLGVALPMVGNEQPREDDESSTASVSTSACSTCKTAFTVVAITRNRCGVYSSRRVMGQHDRSGLSR